MATARQLTSLLRSHSQRDDEQFRVVALQIAAAEARAGHENLALEIQKIIQNRIPQKLEQQLPATSQAHPLQHSLPISRPQGELANLIDAVEPSVGLGQMVLTPSLRIRLGRIVKEQQHFTRLREHGLRPRQRILLLGPPGCGKTMTAHALAHDLGLPLFIVRLDSLFTKYLGETTAKIRVVFDAIERHRAVYLFDEFDSLGLSRGAQHDVAEMRRVLNSLLVFVDNLRGHSLLIAASNHPEALDSALFRRFDDILTYRPPTLVELDRLLRARLSGEDTKNFDWKLIIKAAQGLSFAEASRAADEAIKERLIEHSERLTTEMITRAIKERGKHRR